MLSTLRMTNLLFKKKLKKKKYFIFLIHKFLMYSNKYNKHTMRNC